MYILFNWGSILICLGAKVPFPVFTRFIKELPAALRFVSLFVFHLNFKQVVFMF